MHFSLWQLGWAGGDSEARLRVEGALPAGGEGRVAEARVERLASHAVFLKNGGSSEPNARIYLFFATM